MGQNPEELSTTARPAAPAGAATPEEIAVTRANLSRDIDELADKVTPARIVERRKEAARGRLGSVREKVMGPATQSGGNVKDKVFGSDSSATGGVGSKISGTASGAADTAQGAVGALEARTEGNPLAAGLVAFGAGMVLSALIPASEKETRIAQSAVEAAKDQGAPLIDEAKSVGQDIGADLKDSAAGAAQEVKATAQESVETVKSEGQSSAQTVKDDATPS